MVLRKPYAFLIKHFKLIHLIITALFGYIAIKNREIYVYLKKVIGDTVNRYNASEYINHGIFIYILIAILLCFVIYWLLKYKDKPRRIYIFTIVGYVAISIFMFLLFSYMSGFGSNVIEQKTIRFYRDILFVTLLFQYYTIIFMGIRGLGFDIKKFDFRRDAQELNLGEEDSEEVEINTNIDTVNVMRGIRKQKRELGYFFMEYKWYIIVILILIFSFSGYKLYNYINDKYKIYSENEMIGNMYKIIVKDSYYTIDNDNNYVIVNFDISKNGVRERLDVGKMTLLINNKTYDPDKNICYKFNNLGNCYKKQYITNEYNNYIFVYSVDELNIQNGYLVYNESYDKNYKVKLIMKEY